MTLVRQPNVGEHCNCDAYPGGACDGWCYAKDYSNWKHQQLTHQLSAEKKKNEKFRVAINEIEVLVEMGIGVGGFPTSTTHQQRLQWVSRVIQVLRKAMK